MRDSDFVFEAKGEADLRAEPAARGPVDCGQNCPFKAVWSEATE